MKNKIHIIVGTVLVLIVLGICILPRLVLGIGGLGPKSSIQCTVQKTYIDHSQEGSSYIVMTDAGPFEVDNSFFLWKFDADTTFGNIKEGHKYTLDVSGKRYQNFFMQDFPLIIKAQEIKE